jgi:hypothetical protein
VHQVRISLDGSEFGYGHNREARCSRVERQRRVDELRCCYVDRAELVERLRRSRRISVRRWVTGSLAGRGRRGKRHRMREAPSVAQQAAK